MNTYNDGDTDKNVAHWWMNFYLFCNGIYGTPIAILALYHAYMVLVNISKITEPVVGGILGGLIARWILFTHGSVLLFVLWIVMAVSGYSVYLGEGLPIAVRIRFTS